MKLTVGFDSRDELTQETRERILGSVLHTDEAKTAVWFQVGPVWFLKYDVSDGRLASDVVLDWESDGYHISEFSVFIFTPA